MSDFHQTGVLTTLHRLGKGNLEKMERELEKLAIKRPVALILPCLYSELDGEALPRIMGELEKVRYLREIVVTMGQTHRDEYERARTFFCCLPQKVNLIWNDGPRIQSLYYMLGEKGLSVGRDGKGRSVWTAFGYILAKGECHIIVLHDCDVLTYSRDMLARLCYPVVNPDLDFEFCKGYYSRATEKLQGRVTRLFVTPLLRALQRTLGYLPFLIYLDSFRYPLAGEFSMVADMARINRIPGDWGLEIGTLAEIYRNCALSRVCQVDLADNYEHKHQELSQDDPSRGLMRMAIDIAKTVFRTLAQEGVSFGESFFKGLVVTYLRTAQDIMSRYRNDAFINSLSYDQHEEGIAVEAFTQAIRIAGDEYMADPLGTPPIPNWNRVISAIPDFFDLLLQSVESDNT